jgi:hypothetical protein
VEEKKFSPAAMGENISGPWRPRTKKYSPLKLFRVLQTTNKIVVEAVLVENISGPRRPFGPFATYFWSSKAF